MSVPKLTYFGFGGRVLAARLAFRIGGVAFEDVRVSFPEWPELQKDRTRFPLAQLPTLELPTSAGGAGGAGWADGQLVAQSHAITFYAARRAKLYPSDVAEAAIHDGIVLTVEELQTGWEGYRTVFTTAPNTPEHDRAVAAFTEGNVKVTLGLLEAALARGGSGGFFLPSGLSVADLVVFSAVHFLFNPVPTGLPGLPLPRAVLDGFPRLSAHFARVSALPAVAEFLAAHPVG